MHNAITDIYVNPTVEDIMQKRTGRKTNSKKRSATRKRRPAQTSKKHGNTVSRTTTIRHRKSRIRVLVFLFADGLGEVRVRSSREASLVGRYWAAIDKYLATGDSLALKRIRRKTVKTASGKRIRFIKDLAEIERLGSAGVLSFESLYAKVG